MRLAADCSTSYSRPPTDREKALWLALGIERMIVGTSYAADRHTHVWAATGIEVEEYQFPEALKPTPRRWWVDAETPTATRDSIRNALRRGARGVYTRRGWWRDNLNDWNVRDEFPAAELWDARYAHGDGPCLIVDALNTGDSARVREAIAAEYATAPPFRPYGGFASPAITQWHNSIVIYGINVDLNAIEEPAPAPVQEQDMKPFLVWDIDRQRAYLMGPFGARWITNADDLKTLEVLYGKMAVALRSSTLDALSA